MSDWMVYTGKGRTNDEDALARVPAPPPWRDFRNVELRKRRQAESYVADPKVVQLVNAAIYLRRPLLITGQPGTGKSTLAEAIAQELSLTRLTWSITTRTTLQEGLYRYDALGRLHAAQLAAQSAIQQKSSSRTNIPKDDIGRFITLGPLGTALLPSDVRPGGRPYVLLIDEIDKGDVDLPNDLLHVFEESTYTIDEIMREVSSSSLGGRLQSLPHPVEIATNDDRKIAISSGRVRCDSFPIVIMTSNGERAFPPAFLRRCIRLKIDAPSNVQQIEDIIRRHMGDELYDSVREKVAPHLKYFVDELRKKDGHIATDQMLNLVYMIAHTGGIGVDADALLSQLRDDI